jgi:hypothetical protein
LKFINDGETVELDTSKIISVGGEGIILESGNYKYNKHRYVFDQNKPKFNGKPICTKYTLNSKSCDILFHFAPKVVKDERMPPEYISSKMNSDFIIRNLEIYFCKTKTDIFIGTGKYIIF